MGSKFGLHHLGQPDETTKALERTAPFVWRKQCSPGGDNPTPGIKTIGRSLALTDGEANEMIAVAGAGADVWYGRVRAQMLAARWVHCWELPNEPVVDTRQQCINLGLFTRRAVDLMHADGLKAATGVFSRGRPQLAAALPSATYLRELQPCFDYGDYVALHAYWLRNPQQDAAWLQFRHRLLLAELAALGIKCQPLLLTEAGMDRPGGWRDSGISEAEYWGQLRDNDLALEADKAVLCWTPFTNQPTRDWEPFVITPWLTAKIAEEVRARPPQYEGVPMPTPTIVLVHPLRRPRITQRFAENPNNLGYGPAGHMGLDYGCVEGTVVRAPCSGICSPGNPTGAYSGYGNHLWIKGDDGEGGTFWIILGHLIRVLAEKGDRVEAGNIVALSGNTGHSTAPHLHLGIETMDQNPGFQDSHDLGFWWQNPESFMNRLPG
jgi:hypothetical protein